MRSSLKADELIIGIDPGTRITGYGIIKLESKRFSPVDFGCIRPKKDLNTADVYKHIYEGIMHLLEKYSPIAMAVELQYVDKNVASALKLGMARGMAILASAMHEIPVFEYAPSKAKKSVVGTGSASKEQVQKMIKTLLGLSTLPEPQDAADALALAICHANTRRSSLCMNSSAAG
jgi:crossover junction endodeoxyribonuclease RuvC